MRSWLFVFLLLLLILIHDAQGIRLISKGSVPADDRLLSLHEKLGEMMRSNGGVEGGIDGYKSKKWSGSIRKLTMIHIFSNIGTIAKNDKNEEIKPEALSSTNQNIARKQQNLSVNSPSKTQQPQPTPDILDIAAMDYTLARRKPPIHN